MDTIKLHDPKCRLCRPALAALRKAAKSKPVTYPHHAVIAIRVDLTPDHNAFGKFCGWHIQLVT